MNRLAVLAAVVAGLGFACAPQAPTLPSNSNRTPPASGTPTPVPGGPKKDPPSPYSPAPRLLGRFDTRDVNGPRFAWSGSAIAFHFEGTGLSVRLRDISRSWDWDGNPTHNHYNVLVDGQAPVVLSPTEADARYVLASGLAPGEHTVVLYKRTEAEVGEGQLSGVEVEGGALLAPPPESSRRIELIGDSITAGYGNEGASRSCPFSTLTENHYLTYGALTARALNADAVTVAFSGRGVIRNADGSDQGTMGELWKLSLPSDETSQWQFPDAPDAVVINLGTNDFAQGSPGEQPFVQGYQALLNAVRARYPQAHVYCALGPMLTDYYHPGGKTKALSLARQWLTRVVREANEAGDARVHFIEFPEQDEAVHGLGCDWHPSLKMHEVMADQLTAALKHDLGW